MILEITTSNNVVSVLEDREGVNHRYTVAPGDPYDHLPQAVQDACMAAHTPEAIAEYQAILAASILPSPSPTTDWDGLNGAIMSNAEFNEIYAAVMASHPLIAAALPAALTQVSTGQTAMFATVFTQMCAVAEVLPSQRETWAIIAENFHAPAEFVSIVRGAANG